MTSRVLTIKLTDETNSLQPDTLPAGRLAQLIELYEGAVLASRGASEEGEVAVSITAIVDGCVAVQATHPPGSAASAAELKAAVESADFSRTPPAAQEKLAEMSRLLTNWKYTARLSGLSGGVTEISAARPVPRPSPVRIKSRGTIYGECVKVGGAKPQASVRLFATGKILAVDVGVELAKQLGGKLYDYIGLEGEGLYDEDHSLVAFNARALVPYRGKAADPLAALQTLAGLGRGSWAGVDPEEYVRKLRDEE